MNNYLLTISEIKLLNNVKKYVDTYELLISDDYKKEAYNFALCFYASFLGFLDKISINDKIGNKIILNTLSIDLGIIYDLNSYIYSKKEDDYIDNVIYCYDKAYATQYKNIEHTLNYFLKLHTRIAIASKTSNDETENIQKIKKLICK